jgi:hypothetical protein
MKLRQWQSEFINKALKQYLNGSSHFLALATTRWSSLRRIKEGLELYNELLIENELGSIENGEVCPIE